jgi:hypothetical protein
MALRERCFEAVAVSSAPDHGLKLSAPRRAVQIYGGLLIADLRAQRIRAECCTRFLVTNTNTARAGRRACLCRTGRGKLPYRADDLVCLKTALRPVLVDGLHEFGAHQLGALHQPAFGFSTHIESFSGAVRELRAPEEP